MDPDAESPTSPLERIISAILEIKQVCNPSHEYENVIYNVAKQFSHSLPSSLTVFSQHTFSTLPFETFCFCLAFLTLLNASWKSKSPSSSILISETSISGAEKYKEEWADA